MGWNIFYKECKYLAAHRVLRILSKKIVKVALTNPNDPPTDFSDIRENYLWTTIREIKQETIFSSLMIKDVLFMLFESSPNPEHKEIDFLNSGRISEMQAKIEMNGLTALKDRKYIRMFAKSAKVIIPLIVGIVLLIFPYLKCILHWLNRWI